MKPARLLNSNYWRYGCTGLFFTLFGPFFLWLLLPLGPPLAYIVSETGTHFLRSRAHKYFVFSDSSAYSVSIRRYIASVLPVSILGYCMLSMLISRTEKEVAVLAVTCMNIVLGYVWARIVYKRR